MSDALERVQESRLVLTTEQLAAIGSVAVESTYCELAVERAIWVFLRLDEEQGKFITDRMLLDRRMDLLGNVAHSFLKQHPDQLAILQDIISKLREGNDERNHIIHGEWVPSVRRGLLEAMQTNPKHLPPATAIKRRLNSAPRMMGAAKIHKTAEKIATYTRRLVRFVATTGYYTK